MGATTPDFRAIRGSLRRAIRTAVFRAADIGLLERAAAGIALFDGPRGLYLRGRARALARRNDDHSEFWRAASLRYPAHAAFVRQAIHVALRAGKTGEAEEGMNRLLAEGRAQAVDCNFVLGLAYIYERRADAGAIRTLVRRFLRSLRGLADYRVAALRLSGIVFTYFPNVPAASMNAERLRRHRQFARMLERSRMRPASAELLRRVLVAEEALTSRNPSALLDTDVSRLQCEAFVELVHSRMAEGRPFSLVRVGDGEAACLPYEPYLDWLARGDAIEREKIWWGRPLTSAQRGRMTRLVFNAIWSADSIGIPTASRFLRELRPGESDRMDRGLTGRGLRSILYSVERYETFRGAASPPPVFTSCHIHQDLERWQLYPALLDGRHRVALVSCHSDLADLMERRFGARVAASLILPPDRVSGPALGGRPHDGRLLPDILDEVVERVRDLPRGCLVLVGAGYLGKWLVDVARAQGGVALDVGSVFDYWLGLTTRSYLDLNPVRQASP